MYVLVRWVGSGHAGVRQAKGAVLCPLCRDLFVWPYMCSFTLGQPGWADIHAFEETELTFGSQLPPKWKEMEYLGHCAYGHG